MGDSDIELRKCGVRFDPPAIIVMYRAKSSDKLHLRRMPLRNLKMNSIAARVAEDLKKSPNHKRFLEKLPDAQLEKLITMIKDKMNGIAKEEIVKKVMRSGFNQLQSV